MKNFDNEVAAITGAAPGMGRASLLPHLRASCEGDAVNTCSLFGLISMPLTGNYNTSQFAAHGYTESAALQILRADERIQRRVRVGRDARWADKLMRLLGPWRQPQVVAAWRTARRI